MNDAFQAAATVGSRESLAQREPAIAPIALEKVSKSYETEKALEEISLSFMDQVTTAVVGSSGSGKSTLLQLINGLVWPTAGNVLVFGKSIDYDRLPELRLQIGYAVQGTGLFPHMTVERNITLLARLARWERDRIRARSEELMKLVGLSPAYEGRYPHELSGGQQQRVGLCRALMLDPPLLLLDEPFGALDPVTRNEVHREFLKLQAAGPRTVILVTHDLREAVKLAQHMVILHRGHVEQQGPCAEVINGPSNEFVRGFLDAQLKS
jgi:osmoprotectant transport system ATP-binding protein